jgi:hypothetical protein
MCPGRLFFKGNPISNFSKFRKRELNPHINIVSPTQLILKIPKKGSVGSSAGFHRGFQGDFPKMGQIANKVSHK